MSALRLSYLLVTDSGAADGRVLGMATERMFLRALNHDFGPDDARTTPVPALLTSELLARGRPSGGRVRLMGERIFRHLPVVELDADGNATRCRHRQARDLAADALEIAETTLPATFRVSPLKLGPRRRRRATPPARRRTATCGASGRWATCSPKRAARGARKKAAFAYMQERATMPRCASTPRSARRCARSRR